MPIFYRSNGSPQVNRANNGSPIHYSTGTLSDAEVTLLRPSDLSHANTDVITH